MPLFSHWFWNLVAITVSFTVIIITYIKWLHTYWSRRDVITPKTSMLLGNSNNIFTRIEPFGEDMLHIYKEYKSKGLRYCGYYAVIDPVWIVLDIDLIKNIMTKDFMHFSDHGTYINEKNDPLTGQLFMQTGAKWKTSRAKLTPAFATGKLKMMCPIMQDCSLELINLLDKSALENEPIDIKDIVSRYTTDIIGSCAFGIDCNSLKDPQSEFRYYGNLVFKGNILQAAKLILAFKFPWLLNILKIPLFPQKVINFFLKVVRETVEYREKHDVSRKDFMSLLMELKNNGRIKDDDRTEQLNQHHQEKNKIKDTLTIEEMTAQAFLFFLAGYETSATTLSFCFYELVINRQIQERLRQEIENVYKKYNGQLSYESILEMTYMDRCINETLRKYPPLPVLMRQCTEEYKVPGSNLVIEKGTKVFIPILGIQRDAEYYPDPERFDPDRFTPEEKSKRHPFTWLPFGEGPRVCIGLRFGILETKVALSILLKNYKFSLNNRTVTPLEMDPKHFVMTTKGGIWLNVEKV